MAAFTSIKQMIPGMKVRCLYDRWAGKTGIIINIDLGNNAPIEISWDDPNDNNTCPNWWKCSSFEPIEEIKINSIKSIDCPCGINRKDCTYHQEN